MTPIVRRTSSGSLLTSNPPTMALPAVTGMSVVIMRMSVLLPAPFGPSRPKISPFGDAEVHALDGFKVAVALDDVLHRDGDGPGPQSVSCGVLAGRAHCFTSLALGM